MKVRIFNHDENLNSKKDEINILNLEDLLIHMIYTDGEEDKPVRIVVDTETNKAIMVKYGMNSRENCIKDEASNTEYLSSLNIPHIIRFEFKSILTDAVLFGTEYIRPCKLQNNKECINFRQLSKINDHLNFKYAMLQIIITLSYLQETYRGFRHNDFKADNILIENSPKSNLIYKLKFQNKYKCFRLRNCQVFAKIIDFELANTIDEKNISSQTVLNSRDNYLSKDFGLSPLQCDAFDIHLLIIDILKNVQEDNLAFKKFVYDFFPIIYFFSPNITIQSRLTLQSQEEIQFKIRNQNFLYDMLSHPYFFDLRDDEMESCDYFYNFDDKVVT